MLNAWDNFFYYGLNKTEDEINTDLMQGFIQPEKSLLYFRQEGTGIKENVPNTYSQQMMIRYKIVKWIAFRNSYLRGLIERRVAVSQSYIDIESSGGEMNITVYYIPYSTIQEPKVSTIEV